MRKGASGPRNSEIVYAYIAGEIVAETDLVLAIKQLIRNLGLAYLSKERKKKLHCH